MEKIIVDLLKELNISIFKAVVRLDEYITKNNAESKKKEDKIKAFFKDIFGEKFVNEAIKTKGEKNG